LTGASALDIPLGWPTFLCGSATCTLVLASNRQSPLPLLHGISWSVLPLVAGLFVLVEALMRTGVIAHVTAAIQAEAVRSPTATAWLVGVSTALAGNIANNLPVGLVAASVAAGAHLPPSIPAAILIGVDLGPNLSITGSLATLLWLVTLRREGVEMTAWRFFQIGTLVMPPALLASLAVIGAK
jgi:arsenical pump membrane protein